MSDIASVETANAFSLLIFYDNIHPKYHSEEWKVQVEKRKTKQFDEKARMMSVCIVSVRGGTGRQLLLFININYCSKNMFKR